MKSKLFLYLTCAAGAVAAATPALAQQTGTQTRTQTQTPAASQEQPDSGRVRIEERADADTVTVTGEAFNEVLDQPQSVSVIDAEDRNLAGIGGVRTLISITPGFNYTDTFGLSVRGVGRQTPQTLLGAENTVLQYVDGFLNLVPGNIAESTLFGGNIQFLRGPGGTLYGRNALAGSVNLLSRAPTKEFTGEIEVGAGTEGWYDVGVNVAGPITENLGYRLGAQKFVQPTLQDNIGSAKDAGFAVDNTYYEFQLEFKAGPFHIRNRATHFTYDNKPGYATIGRYDTTTIFGGLAPNPQYKYNVAPPSKPYQINVDYAGFDKLRDNFQDIVNADLDLGFASLVYVGGYQQYVAIGSADLDQTSRSSYPGADAPATFAPGTVVPTDYRSNYYNDNNFWTQELRLESKGGPLDWRVGAYYFNQHFDETYWENIANAQPAILTPTVGSGPALSAPNPRKSTYEQRNVYNIRSTAVFGNIAFDITPTIRFDGGLRYTWDSKDAKTNFRHIFFYPPVFAGDFSPAVHAAQPRRKDSDLSGRAALAWRPSSDIETYAAYSRGYQASAFTLGQGLPPSNIADSEWLDVYEIGGSYTVDKVRFDGSVFYQNFWNMQIPISTRNFGLSPVTGKLEPFGPVFSNFVNASKAVISGMELQATWRPTDRSNIVLSYTHLIPEFDKFCPYVIGSNPPQCGALDITEATQFYEDLSGNEIPRTPHNKLGLYGYYGISLGNLGWLYPGGWIAYQSDYYASPFEKERFHIDGRTVTGFTLTYRSADDRIDVTATLSNAFREIFSDSVNTSVIGAGTGTTISYGPDRFFTVVMRYRL